MASLCVAYRTKQLYIIFACLPLKEKKKLSNFPGETCTIQHPLASDSWESWVLTSFAGQFTSGGRSHQATGWLGGDSFSLTAAAQSVVIFTPVSRIPFSPRVTWKGQIATRVLSCFVGREFIIKRNKNVHPAFCLKGSTVSISQHCFPCKRTRTDNECPLPCKTQ